MISFECFREEFKLEPFNAIKEYGTDSSLKAERNLLVIKRIVDFVKKELEKQVYFDNEEFLNLIDHFYTSFEPDEMGYKTLLNEEEIDSILNCFYEMCVIFPRFFDINKEELVANYYLLIVKMAFNYGYENIYSLSKAFEITNGIYHMVGIVNNLIDNSNMWIELYSFLELKCNENADVLFIKKQRLVKTDSYGYEDLSAWVKEKKLFSDKITSKELSFKTDSFVSFVSQTLMADIIESSIVSYEQDKKNRLVNKNLSEISNHKKGIDYEDECIAALKTYGWLINSTPITNDKGVDIEASKHGLKIVFQCKNWNKKAGTSSVQEIFTGKEIYNADFGIVLSESGLTSQAEQIAKELNIFIINKSEIPVLEALIINSLK